jgi:hypothetical protein
MRGRQSLLAICRCSSGVKPLPAAPCSRSMHQTAYVRPVGQMQCRAAILRRASCARCMAPSQPQLSHCCDAWNGFRRAFEACEGRAQGLQRGKEVLQVHRPPSRPPAGALPSLAVLQAAVPAPWLRAGRGRLRAGIVRT